MSDCTLFKNNNYDIIADDIHPTPLTNTHTQKMRKLGESAGSLLLLYKLKCLQRRWVTDKQRDTHTHTHAHINLMKRACINTSSWLQVRPPTPLPPFCSTNLFLPLFKNRIPHSYTSWHWHVFINACLHSEKCFIWYEWNHCCVLDVSALHSRHFPFIIALFYRSIFRFCLLCNTVACRSDVEMHL